MAYPTNNKKVIAFVEESAKLACPDNIVWIDGSKEQLDELRRQACAGSPDRCMSRTRGT